MKLALGALLIVAGVAGAAAFARAQGAARNTRTAADRDLARAAGYWERRMNLSSTADWESY